MKNKHRLLIIGLLTALLVLVAGIGLAVAQSGGSSQPAPGQQGPGPGFRGRARGAMVAGAVTQVKDDTITVKTAANGDKTVKVDDKTTYIKQGGKATLADVKPGEQVRIMLIRPAGNGEPTARAVMIGKAGFGRRNGAVGNITQVNGNTVTIHTASGDKQFTIPQLAPGERISVITGPDGSVKGIMFNPPQKPAGPPAGGGQSGNQTPTTTSGQTSTGQGA